VSVVAKFTAAVVAPLQTTWLLTTLTVAVGLTVIAKVPAAPVQVVPPLVSEGVTVMVALMGAVVVLLTVKAAILPVPLAARPIPGLLLVQL
jgi:hypothetical protein